VADVGGGQRGALSPNAFAVDQTAIRRFYSWAAVQRGIENPVRVRVIGETFFGVERAALESTPSGTRRANVKWLTPEAFRLWRNLGLRGFTAEGLPAEDWKGRTEDRDVASLPTGSRLSWSNTSGPALPTSLTSVVGCGTRASSGSGRTGAR
jgi:hypothetical protein